MALSAQRALRSINPTSEIVTRANISRQDRAYYGFRKLAYSTVRGGRSLEALRRNANQLLASDLFDRMLFSKSRMISFKRVNALLDISGYSYSDHVGVKRVIRDRDLFSNAKANNKKVILMPKTYGPFEKFEATQIRDLLSEISEIADLMLVRDRRSFVHLGEIGVDPSRMHLFPDYTGAYPGQTDESYAHLENRACVIPNLAMAENVAGETFESYVRYLRWVIQLLAKAGARPFVLIHNTSGDPRVGRQVASDSVPLVQEENPRKIKYIIGRSRITVSARLHGIINSLSQGVPAIAVGWAHKYEELMSDYGVPEYNVEGPRMAEQTQAAIYRLLGSDDEHARVSRIATEMQRSISTRNEEMWKLIAEKIFADPAR